MIGLLLVAHAASFDIQTGVPGPLDINKYGILGYVQNAYILALVAAGILAVASIVYGAVQYTASRGNPSKLSDAWDRIVQALIGILLLLGAGTILSIVNPGLLSLELPQVVPVSSTFKGDVYDFVIPPENTPEVAGASTRADLPPTKSCDSDPSKCVKYSSAKFGCELGKRCTAHQNVIAAVSCAADKLSIPHNQIIFSSGFPPSGYPHKDPGHKNGCSQDLVITPKYAKNCDAIKAFEAAVAACGYEAINEYAYGAFAGCGRKTAAANGGNHVHIYGCPPGTR